MVFYLTLIPYKLLNYISIKCTNTLKTSFEKYPLVIIIILFHYKRKFVLWLRHKVSYNIPIVSIWIAFSSNMHMIQCECKERHSGGHCERGLRPTKGIKMLSLWKSDSPHKDKMVAVVLSVSIFATYHLELFDNYHHSLSGLGEKIKQHVIVIGTVNLIVQHNFLVVNYIW